jgi:hypothetical protein
MFRQEWDDLLPEIEDDLRTGAFMFQPLFTNQDMINSLPAGSTIVEAGDGFVTYYEPEEEDTELVHTLPDHPFCMDPTCPCHEDQELIEEYIGRHLSEHLMTEEEAKRLFRGQQIR